MDTGLDVSFVSLKILILLSCSIFSGKDLIIGLSFKSRGEFSHDEGSKVTDERLQLDSDSDDGSNTGLEDIPAIKNDVDEEISSVAAVKSEHNGAPRTKPVSISVCDARLDMYGDELGVFFQ